MLGIKFSTCIAHARSGFLVMTTRHLHQRTEEHRLSTIGKQLPNIHDGVEAPSLIKQLFP